MPNSSIDEEFFAVMDEIFKEKVPFNKIIGLRVKSINSDRVQLFFEMREELIGNYIRKTLHGGVISTVIDATAALSAFMGVQERMPGVSLEKKLARIGKLGTISLHVDFLRPGLSKFFTSTGYNLKIGDRVAVSRVELHDDQDKLIAVGTGSYIVA